MKKTLILFALMAFLFNAYSQEKKETKKPEKKVVVPELVTKAFAAKYPTVKNAKWGIEKAGEYEAEFEMNKTGISVLFDEKGTLLEVETEITEAALPQPVKATLAKDFVGYKMGEVEKVEAKGVTKYEMEVKKDKVQYEVAFDANGKLLSKEEEKEKGKEKD